MFQISKIILLAAFFMLSCKSSSNEIQYPAGGYKYPYTVYQKPGELFYSKLYTEQWYLSYDEPNLTIKPLQESVFRLVYQTVFGKSAIFILKKNELIVKQPIQGNPYPDYDFSRLNKLEQMDIRILQSVFPIPGTEQQDSMKERNDSQTKLHAKLSDPKYVIYLLNKAHVPDSIPFKYSTKKVSLTALQYQYLVDQVNASGYWKLPRHIKCDDEYLDGDGILLEANTPDKFNMVSVSNCYEKESKFSKACQAIIYMAGLGKEIEIVRKE